MLTTIPEVKVRLAGWLSMGVLLCLGLPVFSQCYTREEARALHRYLNQAVGCEGVCDAGAAPACAEDFAGDILKLVRAHGVSNLAGAMCEQRVTRAASRYVWIKYDRMIRFGESADQAEVRAAREWILGVGGCSLDANLLSRLHTQVRAWFDLRYGPSETHDFPR